MTTFAPSTKDRIGEKMVEVENGQLARTRAGAITSGYLSNYKEFFTETAGEIYGKAWDAALDLTGIDNIISKYVTWLKRDGRRLTTVSWLMPDSTESEKSSRK